MRKRRQAIEAGRQAVKTGRVPRYRLRLDQRTVEEMPWLEFDGDRPAAIAEAARRAIAAELGVRAHQVEVAADVARPEDEVWTDGEWSWQAQANVVRPGPAGDGLDEGGR
jgi:hypothetical protein